MKHVAFTALCLSALLYGICELQLHREFVCTRAAASLRFGFEILKFAVRGFKISKPKRRLAAAREYKNQTPCVIQCVGWLVFARDLFERVA